MKAIIVHSTSSKEMSLKIAKNYEGEMYRIEHLKPVYKSRFAQLFFYGFQTVTNKSVKIKPMDIDLSKYDEVYLVSPVWAGRINAYMKAFLKQYQIKNKKVHIIASCEGGYKNYFITFRAFLDPSNEIVEEAVYVNNELVK